MFEYSILMIIFGVAIFLYGIYIYCAKNPFIPKSNVSKVTKSYKKYVAKITLIVSVGPILSGLVALLGDSDIIMTAALLTLIFSIIIGFIISIKYLDY